MTDETRTAGKGGKALVPQAGRAVLSDAWDVFCAGLRDAGHEALAEARDDLDAADGLQQFGMLTEVALRWFLRGADPDYPRFVEINDTPEVADNLFAAVRGDAVYLITGDVSTLLDFNLSIHSSWVWIKPSLPAGDVGLRDLALNEDGTFELILGGAERPRNWLPLPETAEFIQLREYHADYASHRSGLWTIERIDADGTAPPRQTAQDVTGRFAAALAWAASYGSFHRRSIRSGSTFPDQPNVLRPPAPNRGGNKHIWYGFGRYELDEGQALVLEFARPEARLWSIQWLLDPWYETPDLLTRLTGITGDEAYVDADGRVRIVFAARDPGVRNWLDVSGYPRGLFVTRWIWCEQGPETVLKVVPIADLDAVLPAEAPRLTPDERCKQLSRRRTHFVHRRR